MSEDTETFKGSELKDKIGWVYSPRLINREKFYATWAIILVLAVLWSLTGGSLIESVTIVFLLALALGPGIWDQSFEIDGSRLKISSGFLFKRRLDLKNITRAVVSEKGVFLSPYKSPNRLDSFHGAFLPFAPGKKEDLKSILKNYVVLDA